MNDFDKLASDYEKASYKPDKQHSMLPTMLSLLDLSKNQVVIDVGCGSGFFTEPIAQRVKQVIGIDISKEELNKAIPAENIEYQNADMLAFDYTPCDRISCPFVLNYIQSSTDLVCLFKSFHSSLREGGRAVGIVDMPASPVHDSRQFGAIKRVQGGVLKEGAVLDIELYNNEKLIVKLQSFYHTRETLEDSLAIVGFKRISWGDPIVSQEGMDQKGHNYWEEYKRSCDIAYLVAEK